MVEKHRSNNRTKQRKKNMQSQHIDIRKLHPNNGQLEERGLPRNPRFIRNDKYIKLLQSIRDDPEMLELRELIVYDSGDASIGYIVVGGNMRLRAMKELGYKEAPTKLLPPEFPIDKLRRIILKDNSSFGETDFDILVSDFDIAEIADAAIDIPNVDFGVDDTNDKNGADGKKDTSADNDDGEDDDDNVDTRKVFDVLYDSDNDFEIPTLLKEMQAGKVELPITPWGANSRLRKDVATYHFYVDDYRFEKLWSDPSGLLSSNCKAIVEPNCSCHDQTPIAYGMQLIYKKRWLARYCQECGIKVYVDLNVAPKFIEYNKMGVPKGYNAFFTRGLAGFETALLNDLEVAQEISGRETPNLVVYGGGKTIQKICQEKGLLYITDFVNNNYSETEQA